VLALHIRLPYNGGENGNSRQDPINDHNRTGSS
jgi:hypothetical protein